MLTLFHWLGAICDDFFVPVLEIICEKFKLNDDVAGATFMAAGKNMNIFWKKNQGSRLFFLQAQVLLNFLQTLWVLSSPKVIWESEP